MLTTSPYLRIRRPSPTAVEFTVSTLPPPTLALRLSLWTINILRSTLGLWVLLLLYAIWFPVGPPSSATLNTTSSTSSSPSFSPLPDPIPYARTLLDQTLRHTIPGHLATRAASRLAALAPRYLTSVALVSTLYVLARRLHVEESLLVLRGLGIQTSSSSSLPLPSLLSLSSSGAGGGGGGGGARRRFIPTQKIRDVLINEAFVGFEVVYVLIVIVEGESDVVVVFPRLRPRLDVVETVWRGVRECLYEDGKGGESGVNTGNGNGVEVAGAQLGNEEMLDGSVH